MSDKRKALRFGGLALAVLFGGGLVAILAPRFQLAMVLASFVGYVACTRRALALCRADDLVYQRPGLSSWESEARESLREGLIAGSAGALSLGRSIAGSENAVRSASPRRVHAAYLRPIERAH